MQALFTSIYSKYNGDTTGLKAAINGMHLTEAPQGQTYPYGVYHLISDVPSWIFGTDENTMENYIIQFNLYSENSSSTEVNTAFSALTALYDWCDLSTSGYSNIYMKREMSLLTRESDIWNYMISYRAEIQIE